VDEVRAVCRHAIADPLAHQECGPVHLGAAAVVVVIHDVGAILGEHGSAGERGKKARQRHPDGTDQRAQLHPHPPPSATGAPRAPSRTSWTCCRYLSDSGSRETLISGSASQPRSYGCTQGVTVHPARHAAAAITPGARSFIPSTAPEPAARTCARSPRNSRG